MASNETISRCIARLKHMPAAQGEKWTTDDEADYADVLAPLPDELALAVLARVRDHPPAGQSRSWRPDRGRLLQEAAKLVSPVPDDGPLWVELWHKMCHAGYRVPHWTHPMLEDIVLSLGGWDYLYGLNPHLDDRGGARAGLHRDFLRIYETKAACWHETVVDQLRLPAGKRQPRYFPAEPHAPFCPPPSLPSGPEGYRRAIEPGEFLRAAPGPIRTALRRIRSLPSPPSGSMERIGLTSEDRKRFEAESEGIAKRMRGEEA